MNTATLGSLVARFIELSEEAQGEVTTELEDVTKLILQKTDRVAWVIDALENQATFLDEQESAIAAQRRTLLKAQKRLKDAVKESMRTLGLKKLEGDVYSFSLRACAPSLEVYDVQSLPAKYLQSRIVVEPLNAAIKKDLVDGVFIPGAKLEGGTALVKGISKKLKNPAPAVEDNITRLEAGQTKGNG